MLQIPEAVEGMEYDMESVEDLFLDALASDLHGRTEVYLSRITEELSYEEEYYNNCNGIYHGVGCRVSVSWKLHL